MMTLVAVGSAPATSSGSYDSVWTTLNIITHNVQVYGPHAYTQAKLNPWHITRRRGTNDINCGRNFASTITVPGAPSSAVLTGKAYRPTTLPTVTDTGSSIFWDAGVLETVRLAYYNEVSNLGDDNRHPMALPISWAGATPPAWAMRDNIDVVFTNNTPSLPFGTTTPTLANLISASAWHVGHVPSLSSIILPPFGITSLGGPIGARVMHPGVPSAPDFGNPILLRQSDATRWTYSMGRGFSLGAPSHYTQSIRIMAHGSVPSASGVPTISVGGFCVSLAGFNTSWSSVIGPATAAMTKYGTICWVFDQTIDPYTLIPAGTIFQNIGVLGAAGMVSSVNFELIEPGWPAGFTRDGIPGTIVHPGRIIQVTA